MYKCTRCEKHFYSLVDCEEHLEAVHADETAGNGGADDKDLASCSQVNFKCGYCGAAFGHWNDVRNHSLRDHGRQFVEVTEFAL